MRDYIALKKYMRMKEMRNAANKVGTARIFTPHRATESAFEKIK